MRPSSISLKAIKVALPKETITPYVIPSLSSISYTDLLNNGFGQKNYSIQKTKYGHWPVYLKIQNTKITTEIKRIKGDVKQFKSDLIKLRPTLQVSANENVGYVNIKGDAVSDIKELFDQHIKIN